jgi:hypothetical protein
LKWLVTGQRAAKNEIHPKLRKLKDDSPVLIRVRRNVIEHKPATLEFDYFVLRAYGDNLGANQLRREIASQVRE